MKVKIENIDETNNISIPDLIRRSTHADIKGAEDVLRVYFKASTYINAGKVNGEIACVWGLILPSLLSDRAYLWLLTTDLVDSYTFLFVRNSQRYIEQVLEEFPLIEGHVKSDNDRAKRWLKWLGAKFFEPVGGMISFEIRKKVHG